MDESWLPQAMSAFRRAVAAAGGQAPFERKTGLRQQTVSYRLQNNVPLKSADEVLLVEAALGISRHDLRPDIFPRDHCFADDCPEHGARTPNPREDSPAHPPAGPPTPSTAGGPPSAHMHGLEGLKA